MNPEPQPYDAIIIGAGMSGLAAGIRLAHYEKRVCILERHTTIGGLNSFYRLDGRNYDVGLHAVTNFTPKGTKKGPLARLLRQLRFSWDDFALKPQLGSRIAFPSASLEFSNEFELLRS
ncbi:MAG: NAD(P)-binding protein, partial [Planctomycetes bacterium]|nr:NAD(P)-binding protein [Planctomycetota bacterium]